MIKKMSGSLTRWLERNAKVFEKMAALSREFCRCIMTEFEQWKLAKLPEC
jgi:hypothetical protein